MEIQSCAELLGKCLLRFFMYFAVGGLMDRFFNQFSDCSTVELIDLLINWFIGQRACKGASPASVLDFPMPFAPWSIPLSHRCAKRGYGWAVLHYPLSMSTYVHDDMSSHLSCV